jgi:hypothetical protein
MDKKLLAVCVLTLTAMGLMLANFMAPAKAATSISGGGYQIATGHVSSGGEAVYVLDNRTGYIAVFTYDLQFKQMRPRAAIPTSDLLGEAAK